MTWHYLDGTDQKGPVSEDELAALAARGVVGDHTQVWREGMPQWQPYGQVKSGISISAPVSVASAAPIATAAPGAVACAECGQYFPPSEVIRHGDVYICASCKPVFVQKLREGIAPQRALNYAGFGVRGGSVILDAIIAYVVILPFNYLSLHHMGTAAPVVNFLFNLIFGASYYTFFLGRFGATPGKMANKLKVVNPDGSKIGYGKALGRYFASNWISGVFTLCIGYLVCIWDDQKRTLHDRICSTRVIRKPAL